MTKQWQKWRNGQSGETKVVLIIQYINEVTGSSKSVYS